MNELKDEVAHTGLMGCCGYSNCLKLRYGQTAKRLECQTEEFGFYLISIVTLLKMLSRGMTQLKLFLERLESSVM